MPSSSREHPRPTFAVHSWLPAVVPATATRFRVSDPDLAYTLAGAGAELVQAGADVEIGHVDALGDDAPVVVAQVDGLLRVSATRAGQAARRISTSARVRMEVAAARRALRRRGYRHVTVMLWDRDHVIRVPYLAPPGRLPPAERFPRRALLVATRTARVETALERAIADASAAAGLRLAPGWPIPRAATAVLISDAGVLRAALGPGRDRIDAQKAALAALAAARPPDVIARRTPHLLADGEAGLVRWSLERRLPGAAAPDSAGPALLSDCVEYLVALHRLGPDAPGRTSAARAEAVAPVLCPADAELLRAAARRFDEELADLPRGFAHGDFCTSNLLTAGGRLSGVFDWDGAGERRLPFLDLMHLHLLAVSRADVRQWGGAVVRHVLSDPRAAGDELAAPYFRGIGVRPTAAQRTALAGAYWLDQVGHQLASFLDRQRDREWIARSVTQVLPALPVA